MTFWIIVVAVGVWVFVAAVLLVALCIMASRFNRSEPSNEDYAAYQEAMEDKRWSNERSARRLPRGIP